jgi:hypothetical protein
MSGYTSGNKAPTLMAQAPNRKGNLSKSPVTGKGGVTAVTRPQGSVQYAPGKMGVASTGGNPTGGRGQKVSVSMPKPNCTYTENDGYLKNSSYLK